MIDIAKAEQTILNVLNDTTRLQGEINTKGTFLVFDSLDIKEANIDDVGYKFDLYIAISSTTKNKRLLYQPITDALNDLFEHYKQTQIIELGRIVPYSKNKLIIYKLPLTVTEFSEGEHHV